MRVAQREIVSIVKNRALDAGQWGHKFSAAQLGGGECNCSNPYCQV